MTMKTTTAPVLLLSLACAALAAAAAGCQGSGDAVLVNHVSIVNINPSHGAVGIGYSTDVNVTFSETMKAETFNSSTMCLTSGTFSGATPCPSNVGATVTYDPAALTAHLSPSTPLLPDTTYTLHLTQGIAGVDGALPVEVQASFTTIPTSP